MWPFKKRRNLPGIERDANGQILCTLTDEEEAEVRKFFSMLKESTLKEPEEASGEGEVYIHPEAHKAMTAWALISYAQSQVTLAEMADKGVVDHDLCFRKALAAATKAYSLHPLPIYMFDMGCLFDMVGDNTSARNAFSSFLKSQQNFKPTSIDEIALKQRDVEAAVKEARERVGG